LPKLLDKLVVPQFLSCIVDHLRALLRVPFTQVSLLKQALYYQKCIKPYILIYKTIVPL
jgi:hypothetical protein